MNSKYENIDEYIQMFPKRTQSILKKLRQTIKKVAPSASESISYGIATFKLDGKPLVYFAGFKNHVSVYPVQAAMMASIPKLAKYRSGKGTAKFTLDKPVPLELIQKIVRFRIKENLARSQKKSQ